MKIVELAEERAKRNVNPDLVEHLETLVALAKSGRLTGIAGAIVYADGSIGTAIAGQTESPHLLTALNLLQVRLTLAVIDSLEPVEAPADEGDGGQ